MTTIKEARGSTGLSEVSKCLVYTLFSVMLITVSSSFLYSLGYRGAVPDLILSAVVAVAYYEGERTAAVFGMLSGFALEAVGSTGFSILPLFYMLVGCVSSALFLKILGKNVGAYLLYVLCFGAVRAAISLIYIQFSAPHYVVGTALSLVVFPEFVATAIAAPVVFFIAFLISRRLNAPRIVQEGRV